MNAPKKDLGKHLAERLLKKSQEAPTRDDGSTVPRELAKVTAVTLYQSDLDWLDHATKLIRRAGVRKPSRSDVVREAIRRLKEDVDACESEDKAIEYLKRRRMNRLARELGLSET